MRAQLARVLAVAGAAAIPAVSLRADLLSCGFQDVFLTMEQVPESWWSWQGNNDAMWLWNQYMDIYRYVASDGTWGKNGDNEFGGWPSTADLQATWGFSWGSDDLAMCVYSWGCVCCEISEADVVFNPAYSWTTDALYAEDNPSVIHYLSVLLHELGHSWGEQTKDETYDYSFPSVMHAYTGASVHPGLTIHAPDANLLRQTYDAQTAVVARKDMAVFSHYVDAGLENSFTDKWLYAPGEPLTVHGISVENTGTKAVANAHIRLYLSTNRTITTSDKLLGDWLWTSFPAEGWGDFDLTGTVPLTMADGTYYAGAIVTSDGYGADDLAYNNTTHLYGTIMVDEQCTDDLFEPNDASWQAATVGDASYFNLAICAGDDDWFKVWLNGGDDLDVAIQFSHASGDLDLYLYDGLLQLVDYSDSVTDGETVGISASASAGWYYAKVIGYAGAENGYALHVDVSNGCAGLQFSTSPASASVSAGFSLQMDLCASPAYGNDYYLVLGSQTGSVPGFVLDGVVVPLNIDPYFKFTFFKANHPPFVDTLGAFDASGRASAQIIVPPGADATIAGLVLSHCYLALDATAGSVLWASNVTTLALLP